LLYFFYHILVVVFIHFCKNAAKLTIKTEKSVTFADKFETIVFCWGKSPLCEASFSSQRWG
ncbi:MAG: hypothetical protein IJP08_01760, partial [Bacteroidaceae bacterium]|nr:hypothetical protein [Bacteroidaceae bacterium]